MTVCLHVCRHRVLILLVMPNSERWRRFPDTRMGRAVVILIRLGLLKYGMSLDH